MDSLQYAGVYSDDSQIDRLTIERFTPLKGEINVKIEKITYQGTSSSTKGEV